MSNEFPYVYMAAGLFNADTNVFNAYLTEQLEKSEYFANNDLKCYLPQRDGFEVAKFVDFLNNAKNIRMDNGELMDPKVAADIARYVPYYLDLGQYLSKSRAVVAMIDDPIDSGMVVEIAYAAICNIPVIGLRTDLRSPLGNVTDWIGINPFPAEQCDVFIKTETPTGGLAEVLKACDDIAGEVIRYLDKYIPLKQNKMAENENHIFKNLIQGAQYIFDGIDGNIHTKEAMTEIALNYLHHMPMLNQIAPERVEFPPMDLVDPPAASKVG
ncbi:MAG: hypothetical protein AAF351_07370 [Pseudomonadota bacterium]